MDAPAAERTTGEEYYQFETLTLCFYDRRLIDFDMLTEAEKGWLNRYHRKVYNAVAESLNDKERNYLAEKCKEI